MVTLLNVPLENPFGSTHTAVLGRATIGNPLLPPRVTTLVPDRRTNEPRLAWMGPVFLGEVTSLAAGTLGRPASNAADRRMTQPSRESLHVFRVEFSHFDAKYQSNMYKLDFSGQQ
jgi:hypothetical protein